MSFRATRMQLHGGTDAGNLDRMYFQRGLKQFLKRRRRSLQNIKIRKPGLTQKMSMHS